MIGGFAYFNGEWKNVKDLYVHVSDLGLQRAYGVFDFMKEVKGEIPWLDDYLGRFFRSLELSDIQIDPNYDELKSLVLDLIARNGFYYSGIKLLATGGFSEDGYSVPDKANLFILNMKGKPVDRTVYKTGVNLILDEFIRPNPEVKSIQYYNSAKWHRKMKEYDAIDVLYHSDGLISETSRANFYIVKGDQILTAIDGVLPGVTRKNFLATFANKHDIQLIDLPYEELYKADEAFITSTTKGVVPVVKVEDHIIGDGKVGPMTSKLISEFNFQ